MEEEYSIDDVDMEYSIFCNALNNECRTNKCIDSLSTDVVSVKVTSTLIFT